MLEKNSLVFASSLGHIKISSSITGLSSVQFVSEDVSTTYDKLLLKAQEQILDYLDAKRRDFDLPLFLEGTDFQKAVWKNLLDIPYGKTFSYKEFSHHLGRPDAIRAISTAIGKNPLLIVLPCHRVIGSDGGLTGYAAGLSIKKSLLEIEGITL